MPFAPLEKSPNRYRGRFAPSPTGLLHAGSLVAALASWLDARAHSGAWLVRIEDIDPPRCPAGAARGILAQLAALGLHADEPVCYQSQRHGHYEKALENLKNQQLAYPCYCTRAQIEASLIAANAGQPVPRHAPRPYPRTCRTSPPAAPLQQRHSWRFDLTTMAARLAAVDFPLEPQAPEHNANAGLANADAQTARKLAWHVDAAARLHWSDRALGAQSQDLHACAGDVVVRRSDGLWAYPLAVVADDAAQGITHVVRGADLASQTPTQLVLQAALGVAAPQYLHTPLVCMPDGEKLSKQHGAPPIDTSSEASCCAALQNAAEFLGLPRATGSAAQMLHFWVGHWTERWLGTRAST